MILGYKQGCIGDWSNGKFSMRVLNLVSSFLKMLVKTGRVSAFLKQMTSVLGATARKLPVISWLLVALKLITLVQSTFLTKMTLLQFFIAGTCRKWKVQIRAHTFSLSSHLEDQHKINKWNNPWILGSRVVRWAQLQFPLLSWVLCKKLDMKYSTFITDLASYFNGSMSS